MILWAGSFPMLRLLAVLAIVALASGCGGGGGGDAGPDSTPAVPPPEPVALFDAIPAAGTTVRSSTRGFNLIHLGPTDWRFDYGGECTPMGVAVRRTLSDLSDGAAYPEVIDHKLDCALQRAANYEMRVDATATDGTRHRATLEFASDSASVTQGVVLLESLALPRQTVNALYGYYVREVVLDDIDSRILRAVAASIIAQLARRNWNELGSNNARYGTISERVSYSSRAPSGEGASLTGLVVRPLLENEADFQPPPRVLVLSHGTGSTPSDLDANDGWFMVANLLAGRGFLVVAPDNWGRGEGDGQGKPETYLMANRVAHNGLDMLNEVLADPRNQAYHDSTQAAEVAVIGYSQGAHSALALWLAHASAESDTVIREIYAGGGPHDVYQTFRGGLEHLAGRCDGNPWCREVDGDVVLSYATDRILPAYLEYTDVGLELAELVNGNRLSESFITGMLDRDERFDALKTLMQLNSFTNLVDLAGTLPVSDTRIQLFHSSSDRLVPRQNSVELAEVLIPGFDTTFHSGECDSNFYEQLARIGTTGLVHAICAFEMFDRVMRDLRSIDVVASGSTLGVESDAGGPWRELAELGAKAALKDGETLANLRAGRSSDELRVMSEGLRALDSPAAGQLAERIWSGTR